MRRTLYLLLIALALGATAATTGCGARSRGDGKGDSGSRPRVDAALVADAAFAPRFTLRILADRIEIPRDYDKLVAQIKDPASAPAMLALDERDIARYRVDPAPSRRVQLEWTDLARKERWSAFAGISERHPFVVLLDGKLLYAGVTYFLMGAAGIDTPVLGVDPFGGPTPPDPGVMRVGATMGAWGGWGKDDPAQIDRPELRTFFEARGSLGSL
jgi:hypothetical protein